VDLLDPAHDERTDLRKDPERRPMDGLDLVLRQDLDRSIRVDESAPRELPDAARLAPSAAVHRLVFAHAPMLRLAIVILRPVSASASSIRRSRRIDRQVLGG